MHAVQIISVLVLVVLVGGMLARWQLKRADEILCRWAQEEGMEVVSAHKRYFRTGPFFFRHGRGQFVFRITVRDQAGVERTGWLRVGGWLAGVMSDKTKVIWDS